MPSGTRLSPADWAKPPPQVGGLEGSDPFEVSQSFLSRGVAPDTTNTPNFFNKHIYSQTFNVSATNVVGVGRLGCLFTY